MVGPLLLLLACSTPEPPSDPHAAAFASIEAHVEAKDLDAALAGAQGILTADPDHIKAHQYAGWVHVLRKDCKAAMPHLDAHVRLVPGEAEPLVNRAFCRKMKDMAWALDDLRPACAMGHKSACDGVVRLERIVKAQASKALEGVVSPNDAHADP